MPPLDSIILPCTTTVGTRPTFYLVSVNQALSDAVTTGRYPPIVTEVRKCVTIAGHNRSSSEGMEKRGWLSNVFLAFKALAKMPSGQISRLTLGCKSSEKKNNSVFMAYLQKGSFVLEYTTTLLAAYEKAKDTQVFDLQPDRGRNPTQLNISFIWHFIRSSSTVTGQRKF